MHMLVMICFDTEMSLNQQSQDHSLFPIIREVMCIWKHPDTHSYKWMQFPFQDIMFDCQMQIF